MKQIKWIFFVTTCFILCGNVFALSPYAQTIQQNIHKKSFLSATSFPTTVADAPFVVRMENKREDYLPYFNRSAFQNLPLDEQYELESMAYRAEKQRQTVFASEPLPVYCEEYPDDSEWCPGADTSNTEPSPTAQLYPITPPATTTTVYPSALYMRASLTPNNVAQYNLKTHDGGCTPPERNNVFANKILTSGQYQNSQPAFEKFMITAFRKEGGCVNDPNDHGGYTCYGCASNGLCHGVDFKTLTRAKVENLAYDQIYRKYNLNKLPDAFRGYALWGMWGSGSITGIKQFQGALGVPLTGKIDDATIYAAEHYTGDFADTYTKNREQFLRNLVAKDPSQRKFLKGWLNGLNLLRPSGCHVVPTNPIYR